MDDDALRNEIEQRVREHAELAWSAMGERKTLSENSKEFYIRAETKSLLEVTRNRRLSEGITGPVSDDEWHEVHMQRNILQLDHMLAQLKAGADHPMRQSLIEMIEEGKKDMETFPKSPTDEDVTEMSRRMVAQFEKLTPRDGQEARKLLGLDEDDDEE